jgi:hypothetical protein
MHRHLAPARHVAPGLTAMAIPPALLDDALARVQALCDRLGPPGTDRIRLTATVDGNAIVIADERAPWDDPAGEWTSTPVARLRWTATRGEWSLQEPTFDGGWTRYRGERGPTRTVAPQLAELEADPTGIFRG